MKNLNRERHLTRHQFEPQYGTRDYQLYMRAKNNNEKKEKRLRKAMEEERAQLEKERKQREHQKYLKVRPFLYRAKVRSTCMHIIRF